MIRISHFGLFSPGNAGDTMLFKIVQEAIKQIAGLQDKEVIFHNHSVHNLVTQKTVDQVNNEADIIVVGGGGLFLRDTKANENSGWQWNCPVSMITKFTKPIYLFGVGYNRFRGQKEFDPIFKKHINTLAAKAEFIGLRNSGSVERIQAYLNPTLHSKIILQPCPTTIISKLDISHIVSPELSAFKNFEYRPRIVLNIPFDRADMRYGVHKDTILKSISKAMKHLEINYNIEMVFHCSNDLNMLVPMEIEEVKYTTKHLEMKSFQNIIDYYYLQSLLDSIVISGRGHGQMIPFGFGNLFLSLISHNKLAYFLRDTNLENLGIEVTSNNLQNKILAAIARISSNMVALKGRIAEEKEKLWDITCANVAKMLSI
jgi:polysaccharide pyruvyl transferase WcaK-like protein